MRNKSKKLINVAISVAFCTLLSTTAPLFSQERQVKKRTFDIGEQLTFSVNFGPFNAGTLVMTVEGIKNINDSPCYHILYKLNSEGFLSLIYKVEDVIETFIDTVSLQPLLFKKHLREGGYKDDRLYYFDHVKNIAYNRTDTVTIPPYTQDMLSIFYYLRTLELDENKVIEIPNFDNGKIITIRFKIRKGKTVSVEAGRFKSVILEPTLASGEKEKPKGSITVWLTDDERKIPVLIKMEIKFGSITAKLTGIKNVKKN